MNNVGNDSKKPVRLAVSGKYSELPLRVASALILGGFAVYASWAGGLTFSLLIFVATVFTFVEFRSITSKSTPLRVSLFAFGFLMLFCLSWLTDRSQLVFFNVLMISMAGAIALAIWEFLLVKSAWGALGLVYAAAPFFALNELRLGKDGLFLVAFVFACVWGADIFAYFFGKILGGPKLAPSISPNKTWSGFFGGLVGAGLFSGCVVWWAGYALGFAAFSLAIVLALFAQIGDLFESSLKRHFGVKDSGWIIPGHGGILDRIDGLIFASTAAFLIALGVNAMVLPKEGISSKLTQTVFLLPQ